MCTHLPCFFSSAIVPLTLLVAVLAAIAVTRRLGRRLLLRLQKLRKGLLLLDDWERLGCAQLPWICCCVLLLRRGQWATGTTAAARLDIPSAFEVSSLCAHGCSSDAEHCQLGMGSRG